MKLYYAKGACSLTVRILVHELNLACEFEAVSLQTKQTENGANFLAINAKGAVPTVILDSGEVLTENAVILQYLADQHHASTLLPLANQGLKRYRVLEWLNFISTDLHKNCSPLFNSNISQELKRDIFLPILKNKLSWVEQHLMTNTYLLGEQFTLADIYLFVVMRWLPVLTLNLSDWPHIERYFMALKTRSAIQKALKEEGLA